MFDSDSYRTYKECTRRISKWAQTSALKIDDPERSPVSSSSSSEADSAGRSCERGRGRGRGGGWGRGQGQVRGRGQAQERGQGQEQGRGRGFRGDKISFINPDLSPTFSLTQLQSYITTIASSSVRIPPKMLAIMRLNIALRKQVAAFYSWDTTVEEKNRSHRYAISVFEKVLASLEGVVKSRENEEARPTAQVLHLGSIGLGYHEDDEEGMVKDLFAVDDSFLRLALEMEELGMEGEEEDPWAFALEEYELTDDAFLPLDPTDEAFEALMAFLFDIDKIRRYCCRVWDSVVPSGTTSHISASFVTNRALQLVKEKESALYVDFPVLKDLAKSFASVFQFIFVHVGKDKMDNGLSGFFIDSTMFDTYTNLVRFAEMRKQFSDTTPVLREGVFGSFNPSADRRGMSEEERFYEDRFLMNTHWSDLALISLNLDFPPNWLGKTGLAQEFESFIKGDLDVTWGLIFACQMQADTVQSRRPYLESDAQRLRDIGAKMIREHDQFLASHLEYGDKQMEAFVRPQVRLCREALYHWTQANHLTDAKVRVGYRAHACKQDSMWYYNPWLTANAISESVLNTFFASLKVVESSGFVYSAIHLWNMLQQSGDLRGPLTPPPSSSRPATPNSDLRLFDHLLNLFGPILFSGLPPRSTFLRSWAAMMGIHVHEFVRDIGQQTRRQQRQLRTGRIQPVDSEAWALHRAGYDPPNMEDGALSSYESSVAASAESEAKEREDRAARRRRHPLVDTFEMINSELGIASPPSTGTSVSPSLSRPRGPFISLDLFKIHTLALRLFAELEPVLRPEIETRVTRGTPIEHGEGCWLWLTGYVMISEALEGRVDKVLLAKTGEVVKRVLGNEMVAGYLVC